MWTVNGSCTAHMHRLRKLGLVDVAVCSLSRTALLFEVIGRPIDACRRELRGEGGLCTGHPDGTQAALKVNKTNSRLLQSWALTKMSDIGVADQVGGLVYALLS